MRLFLSTDAIIPVFSAQLGITFSAILIGLFFFCQAVDETNTALFFFLLNSFRFITSRKNSKSTNLRIHMTWRVIFRFPWNKTIASFHKYLCQVGFKEAACRTVWLQKRYYVSTVDSRLDIRFCTSLPLFFFLFFFLSPPIPNWRHMPLVHLFVSTDYVWD